MAWRAIPNNPEWEYDDAATANDTYSKTPGTISGGIRTYTTGSFTNERQTYIKCRKVNGSASTGELDKTYYDNRGS